MKGAAVIGYGSLDPGELLLVSGYRLRACYFRSGTAPATTQYLSVQFLVNEVNRGTEC